MGVPVVLLSYIKFNWVVVNLRSKQVDLEVVDVCKPTLSATKAMKEKVGCIHQGVREVVMHSVLCFFWLQSTLVQPIRKKQLRHEVKERVLSGPSQNMMPLFTVWQILLMVRVPEGCPEQVGSTGALHFKPFWKKTEIEWHPTCPIERLTFRLMRRQQMFVCPRKIVDYPTSSFCCLNHPKLILRHAATPSWRLPTR